MCGRFALTSPPDALREIVDFVMPSPAGAPGSNWPPRYNIAPSQPVAIIAGGAQPQLALVQWGLVPSWVRADALKSHRQKPQINARAETIAEKPSFRDAFKRRRCLIPANGYYEWKRPEGQPYLIHRPNCAPFFMAGIWEHWQGADGSEIESCAIVTCAANDALGAIHHRMPVTIEAADAPSWLQTDERDRHSLMPLLQAAPEDAFAARPVGRRVNKVGEDGVELWEEVTPNLAASKPDQLDLF